MSETTKYLCATTEGDYVGVTRCDAVVEIRTYEDGSRCRVDLTPADAIAFAHDVLRAAGGDAAPDLDALPREIATAIAAEIPSWYFAPNSDMDYGEALRGILRTHLSGLSAPRAVVEPVTTADLIESTDTCLSPGEYGRVRDRINARLRARAGAPQPQCKAAEPTRKIVSIHRVTGSGYVVALCDDNTVWAYDRMSRNDHWERFPVIPGTAVHILPERQEVGA